MTDLGHNIIPDASFNNPSQWQKTELGEGVVTFENGRVHFFTTNSSLVQIQGISAINYVPGSSYLIRARGTVLVGGIAIVAGGVNYTLNVGTGVRTFITPPVSASEFHVKRAFSGNTDGYLEWVSVRRIGDSMSKLVLTMRDFDGDKRQTSIEMGAISDGTSYGTVSAQMATLAAAIDDVTAGNIARQQYVSNDTEPNDTNAANLVAQTSYRWIIEYVDATTGDGPYQIDIPTPDLSDNTLVLAGSNHHDPADAKWVTLKAAMHGEVKNPRTGNDITITAIFLEQ